MKQVIHQHPVAFCHYYQPSVCFSSRGIFNFHPTETLVGTSRKLHYYLKSSSSSDFGSSENENDNNKERPILKDNMNNSMHNSKDIEQQQQQQQQQDNYDDELLDFDDEELLEEFMQFSTQNDLDVVGANDLDSNFMDFDNELKELERFLDERTLMNGTVDEFIDFEDDGNDNISMNMDMDMDMEMLMSRKYSNIPSESTSARSAQRATSLDNSSASTSTSTSSLSSALEKALLQGVVPAAAGVGSNCLPGDYGFDPFGFSTKDYFKQVQNFLLSVLPSSEDDNNIHNEEVNNGGAALPLATKPASTRLYDDSRRPNALILRDYREAEIRHGRLAMLASILWPLQEIIDKLFMPESFGKTTFVYGGPTLPFISLFMTLTMLLLGYLDIYAASIKDGEAGDAFLPGECFWDPLSILDGAPDPMKRRMQERELNNGRMAMIAVLSYIIQEGITHEPVINLPWNQFLFEPAFEIPQVQAWLDVKFSGASSSGNSILQTVGVDDLELMMSGFDHSIDYDPSKELLE